MPTHTHRAPTSAPYRVARGAVGVALVLAFAGFLFVANARLAGSDEGREAQDLPGLVSAEMRRTEKLAGEVEALRVDVSSLTTELTRNANQKPVSDPLVELAAGQVPVAGPGVSVTLTDAPAGAPRPDWAVNDDLVVHQQDLQAVVNALWAGGAEAMTLQGQRVVSTSAFRCVGNVLLLHGRHYSPPYVVQAIGDPDALEASLYRSRAIQTYLDYVDAVGLGWGVEQEGRVELPAYEGSLELQHAVVPEADRVRGDA